MPAAAPKPWRIGRQRYPLEDIRDFLYRRTWPISARPIVPIKSGKREDWNVTDCLVTAEEYEAILAREDPGFSPDRLSHIRSYIRGYRQARR